MLSLSNYQSIGFNDVLRHELNELNFLKSGREWYGESFDIVQSQMFSFNFPNVSSNDSVSVKSSVDL